MLSSLLKPSKQKFAKVVLSSILTISFTSMLVFPVETEAKSLMKSISSAAAKKITGKTTSRRIAIKEIPVKPKEVILPRSKYPESAAHIQEAQRLGQPSVLTFDPAGNSVRRNASMKHIDRPDDPKLISKDRDEYPPAMFKEGGANADVRYIDAKDNRGSGSSIYQQLRDYPEGTRVKLMIID